MVPGNDSFSLITKEYYEHDKTKFIAEINERHERLRMTVANTYTEINKVKDFLNEVEDTLIDFEEEIDGIHDELNVLLNAFNITDTEIKFNIIVLHMFGVEISEFYATNASEHSLFGIDIIY